MKAFTIVVLVVLAAVAAHGAKIAVVGPRSDGLLRAVEAAALDVYSTNTVNTTVYSSLTITPFWLSGSAMENLVAAQTAAADTSISLAIVSSDDSSIAAVFGEANIPVIHITSQPDSELVKLKVGLSSLPAKERPAAQLLGLFGWTSACVLYSPEYAESAQTFQAAAMELSPSFKVAYNATLDLSFPNSIFSQVIGDMERSASRIVVVLGSAPLASKILASIRDTRFEFIMFDPLAIADNHLNVDVSSLLHAAVVGNPRALFTVSLNEDRDAKNATILRLQAFNSTVFSAGVARDALLGYEGVFLYAHALKAVFDAGQDNTDGALVHASMISAPKAVFSSLAFDANNYERIGNLAIYNLHVNMSRNTTTWFQVGSAVEDGTVTIPQMSLVSFADGTSTVPSSSQDPMVSIGMIWPNLRPLHTAWRIICAQAAEDINANGTILPGGRKVRVVYSDNFDSASSTILSAVDLLSRGVIGIVGPARSAQSIALQYYIGGLRVPAVSMGSTLDLLSDKVNYPTFFRTVLRDSFQSTAMARFIKHQNWTSFCVINDNTEYSSGVASNLINEAISLGLQVSGRGVYAQTTTDFSTAIAPVASSGCRIIVAVVDTTTFGGVLRHAKSIGMFGEDHSEYVWIFSEILSAVLNSQGIAAQNLTLRDFHGTIQTKPVDGSDTNPLYQRFKTVVGGLLTSQGYAMPSYNTFIYDAVWALARAAGKTFVAGKDPTVDRSLFLSYLKNSSFDGASGLVEFDKNQDRVGAVYGIYNFRAESALVVPVGLYSNQTGVVITSPIVYGDNTTTTPRDRAFIGTGSILFSYAGPGIIVAIAALILAILLATAIVIAVKSVDKEDAQSFDIVRKSSPVFLWIILFGLALAVVSVFFWFAPTNDAMGPARCHLRVWLAFIGCAIAYAALLAKNWRLWYLFNEPSLRVVAIKNNQLLSILSLVVLPLVIVLVLWSAINPFQEVERLNVSGTFRYYTCESVNDKIFAGISFAYMGVLLLFGAILSWKTRTLPDTFKESQYIALSTYNLLFVSAIGVLVGYVVSYEPTAYTFIIVVCILFGAFATWALIFIPKFYIMRYGPPSSRGSSGSVSPHGTQQPSAVSGLSGMGKHSLSTYTNRSGATISEVSSTTDVPKKGSFAKAAPRAAAETSSSADSSSEESSSEPAPKVAKKTAPTANQTKTQGQKSPAPAAAANKKPAADSSSDDSDEESSSPKVAAKPANANAKKHAKHSSSSSDDADSS